MVTLKQWTVDQSPFYRVVFFSPSQISDLCVQIKCSPLLLQHLILCFMIKSLIFFFFPFWPHLRQEEVPGSMGWILARAVTTFRPYFLPWKFNNDRELCLLSPSEMGNKWVRMFWEWTKLHPQRENVELFKRTTSTLHVICWWQLILQLQNKY